MFRVDVEAPLVPVQMQKMYDYPRIAREEFTAAMRPALALSVADVSVRAPVGGGELRGSLRSEIKFAVGDEVRGVVTASATAPDGFPYGYALDASTRYRYAGKRTKTKSWMKGVIRRKRNEIYALFAGAAVKIVNRLAVDGVTGER